MTSSALDPSGLPYFFRSFENLSAHFDEHFGELGSNERGDTFLELARRIVTLSPEGEGFTLPTPSSKKSHDGGIDMSSRNSQTGRVLYGESKYKVREKIALDSILSKFKSFEESVVSSTHNNLDLFLQDNTSQSTAPALYFVITSSKLEQITERYLASTLASKEFYEELVDSHRLVILDGPRILELLQSQWRKQFQVPAEISIESLTGWHSIGSVYTGIVRGGDIAALYHRHGDGLFFENIRDFLGVESDRKGATEGLEVNHEIQMTVREEPSKMLARNNGVTLRASKVSLVDNRAELEGANIINGCQTTMCLFHSSPVPDDCLVTLKIVETDDAWDIAKSANYQNYVHRIELDLARYLRPQQSRRLATELGYAVDASSDISSAAAAIYQNKFSYIELKSLYIGLFSRSPNNIFEREQKQHRQIKADVLAALYKDPRAEERIFSVLMLLLKETHRSLDLCQARLKRPPFSTLFQRFYDENKPRYRAFLAVVAAAVCVERDISIPETNGHELQAIKQTLDSISKQLENEPEAYRKIFLMTFLTIMRTVRVGEKPEKDVGQVLFSKMRGMNFTGLYNQIRTELDAGMTIK